MSVYVDTPIEYAKEPAGYVGRARAKARWCHMIADTEAELHAMAQQIGLWRSWFQQSRSGDHYDLVPTKRTQAIALGAIALDRRAFVAKLREIRKRRLNPHGCGVEGCYSADSIYHNPGFGGPPFS